MKRVAVPTQPVTALFAALFFVVAFTLAGCSASTISGPEPAPVENVLEAQHVMPLGPSVKHNEGIQDDDLDPSKGSKTGRSHVTRVGRN